MVTFIMQHIQRVTACMVEFVFRLEAKDVLTEFDKDLWKIMIVEAFVVAVDTCPPARTRGRSLYGRGVKRYD